MIELTFLKELILIKQMHQRIVIFATIGTQRVYDLYNVCHYLLVMSINLIDIIVLNIQGVDYSCIIDGVTKYNAINLLQNTDFTESKETSSKFLKMEKTYYQIQNW